MEKKSLLERDRECVWHPYDNQESIPILKGKGSYLYAQDGTRYLDAISSWWVNLYGHTHPYIVQKIQEQVAELEQVIFAGFTHPRAVELAERLIKLLPGKMDKVFYSDNGSTAVEVALKMALQYWYNKGSPRKTVVCFNRSYHGDTFGAMSVAGKNGFNRPFWSHLFEVKSIDPPLLGRENESLNQFKSIIRENQVACFIFEPLILGAGGMIIYPAEGLDQLLKCCQEHEILTIADEVMTGFGRTGSHFACDSLRNSPDLICLSKGLTGGFLPLGVTASKKFIYDTFTAPFLHGHSYTANPIACASALASLDLLESYADERLRITECHRQFCKKWDRHPRLSRCESLGTILVLEYATNETSYFHPLRDRLYQYFIQHQLLLRPLGNVLYVMPPYCMTNEELEVIYEKIAYTLENYEDFHFTSRRI